MTKISFRLLGLVMCFGHMANSQVVITNPLVPTDYQSVTVTFYAAQGSQGLMGYTGDVYAHTGVITDKSASSSDWKYVKADWTVNKPECKLTRITTDVYALTISPSVREFYGVPASEKILKMAFVFRSGDRTKQGKDTDGKDILVEVYGAGVNVAFAKPSVHYSVVDPGSLLPIEVNAANNQTIDLYLNGELLSSAQGNTLSYGLTVPASGKHMLRAVAGSESESSSDTAYFLVKSPAVSMPRPLGLKRGANRVTDQSVILNLFAPHKEFVYLAGDFNDWMPDALHQMKRDGDYFWLQLDGLSPNTEYAYQYWIDNALKIADPYANMVLDPSNDKYITPDIYPNLKKYPIGKTDDLASVFATNPPLYQWQVTSFTPPAPDTLVVYELHIRDFTANKDIKTVTDTLAYLKRMGVNAIELMPFNEFEGNDSWGYNPSFYFATDKAYGPAVDYKQFVDACHQQGMAVLMDMVLNHSFGQSPLVRMYFENGKPAANNPWYNVNHNMQNPDAQWGYDFNHQSTETQALVDSVCAFWMGEFKIDGFRFDFTKGFTNTVYGTTDWASAYDAQRIGILKRMSNEIWKRKPNALVIFEHLSDNSEEMELAAHGILLWGNHNHNFNEGTMGYTENNKSDFSWADYKRRGWSKPHIVNYMESHDEERLMYKNLTYGNVLGSYNVKDLSTALKRMELAGAFLFSVPGPNMIWQFGEMGYDVSIDTNGRTGAKPVKWEYLLNADRRRVSDVWATFIKLKKTEPVFSTSDFEMNVTGAFKQITLRLHESHVVLLGNFGMQGLSASVVFPSNGWWYDYFNGDSMQVNDGSETITLGPGEYKLLSMKKLNGFESDVTPPETDGSVGSFAVPNPFAESLTVLNLFPGDTSMEVHDLSGRKLFALQNIGLKVELDTSGWQKGFYIMTLVGGNGQKAYQKVLKL